ncbi:MAG: hypothetical protein K0B05_05925 [Bacteroidales bacterium]|nr:hypothetical protein [Bacteroidales bacterium]
MYRTEKDTLGEIQIPSEALYGIHALRASGNFPAKTPFPVEWYRAVGLTKLACYNTYRKFSDAALEKYGEELNIPLISNDLVDALAGSASEVAEGKYFEHFIVPAVQGGAGTSINMNVNEIIANAALLRSGRPCGDYKSIDPTEHANIYQSTNDVIPTALTLAVMKLLQGLESLNLLISANLTTENNLIEGLVINESSGSWSLLHSPAITTALIPYIGYHQSARLSGLMKEKNHDIIEANRILKIIEDERLREIIKPGNLLKLGFSLDDPGINEK